MAEHVCANACHGVARIRQPQRGLSRSGIPLIFGLGLEGPRPEGNLRGRDKCRLDREFRPLPKLTLIRETCNMAK
jgi:hypothetical protein